jgi:hypothetical protein
VRSATIVRLLPGETLSTSLRLTRLAKTPGMLVILDLKHDAADVVRLASQKVFDVAPIDGVPRSAPYSRLIGEVRRKRSWAHRMAAKVETCVWPPPATRLQNLCVTAMEKIAFKPAASLFWIEDIIIRTLHVRFNGYELPHLQANGDPPPDGTSARRSTNSAVA